MFIRHPRGYTHLELRTGWRWKCGCPRYLQSRSAMWRQGNASQWRVQNNEPWNLPCWMSGERRIHKRNLEGITSEAGRKPWVKHLGREIKIRLFGPLLHSSVTGLYITLQCPPPHTMHELWQWPILVGVNEAEVWSRLAQFILSLAFLSFSVRTRSG